MVEGADYFGTPPENMQAALNRADKYRKKHQFHTKVPTRKEVATLPVGQLTALLVGWMEHSAIEIIPSRMQIALARETLQARPDRQALQSLIEKCGNYVDGQ